MHRFLEKSSVPLLIVLVIGLSACNRFNQSYNEIPKLPPADKDFTQDNLKILNTLIEDDDENDELYWQRSILYQRVGKPELALADIKKAIELDDEKYHYYKTLAQAYLLNQKYDSAISSATYSRNSGNDDYQLNLILAEAYLNMGDVKKSMAEINYALKIDSNNYYTYYLRGMARKAMKDSVNYQNDFLKALSYRPEDKKVYKEIMDYYLENNQTNSAKSILDKMFDKFSPDTAMIRQKGEFFETQNKLDSAYLLYGTALQQDSSLYHLSLRMGDIKLKGRDYITALKHFQHVLRVDKDNFEAQYKSAICNESLRNFPEAISAFERALVLDSTKTAIHNDISRVNKKILLKEELRRQRLENERRVEPLPELPTIN